MRGEIVHAVLRVLEIVRERIEVQRVAREVAARRVLANAGPEHDRVGSTRVAVAGFRAERGVLDVDAAVVDHDRAERAADRDRVGEQRFHFVRTRGRGHVDLLRRARETQIARRAADDPGSVSGSPEHAGDRARDVRQLSGKVLHRGPPKHGLEPSTARDDSCVASP
jgi:hypothetical protein